MKRILGLDLGTNSIGWAVIEIPKDGTKRIIKLGSRIVPMDGGEISDFKRGLPQTKNATRREKKGIRVGNKRYKQRRNKLVYILQKLDMLPSQIMLSNSFSNPKKIQKINILPIFKDTRQLTGKEFLELRARAIHEPVSAKDFGKILYRFNQLRGYAGSDEQDDEADVAAIMGIKKHTGVFPAQVSKVEQFKILFYEPTVEKKHKKTIYKLKLLDADNKEWQGETITENLTIGDSIELKKLVRQNKNTGDISSIEFSIPSKTGWRKQMETLEESFDKYSEFNGRKTYISEYFLDELKGNRWKRIRDNVILRSRYLEEFDAIWKKQYPVHLANINNETVEEIASFLFPGDSDSQIKFRQDGVEKGLYHIIRNQIIYYQRELKDQSHLISHCRFEPEEKAVTKSHPLFQEFKIWEQINKLSIKRKIANGFTEAGKAKFKYDERPIPADFKEHLFSELQKKRELAFGTVFNKLKKAHGFDENSDFFNGLSTKAKLKGNNTRTTLEKRLGRFWKLLKMNSVENQIELWDLLYNQKGNEYDLESNRNKKIANYLKSKGIDALEFDKIVIAISCIKFPRDYASISLKAVKKVLPLVRAGKYYDASFISEEIFKKITTILNSNVTDAYDKSLQSYLDENENDILKDGGFINAYALMLAYGKHTAKKISGEEKYDSPNEIKVLERHSLRNPLVEQMINETLMVVKDIWKQYGQIDEIKVELAREMKSSIKERSRTHERMEKNQKVNSYIKYRLREINEEISKSNIERYKLWERQENDNPAYLKRYEATKGEVEKMKLWQEQGHIDPYTNQPIPLSGLFNKGLYDIDHIIPQSRYFNDGLANKVVCLQKVNKDKGNRTAIEYIEAGSRIIDNLLTPEEFVESVGNRFYGLKRKFLLATKIPEDPIERQKKETQFIVLKGKEELAKIVGSDNVKTSTGGVTHYLRNHWGLTPVFKKILKPRFERFYKLKAEKEFETYLKEWNNEDEQPKTLETFTEDYIKEKIFYKDNNLILKGWSKRYDHRHHAMDALTVALTNEKAVKRLNDLNKHLKDWVKKKYEKGELKLDPNEGDLLDVFLKEESEIRDSAMKEVERFRNIPDPWKGFQNDARKALEEIIVSYKPKDKLLLQYDNVKNNGKVEKQRVIKIRGPLHEETIYGLSSGLESKRVNLSDFSSSQMSASATKTNIEKICNDYLREVISDHFHNTHGGSKKDAFGPEGLLGLNKRLAEKTKNKNGKEVPAPHPPISSVKIYRKKPKAKGKNKISLQKLERDKSYNDSLYVNTGSNYLFAILEKNGKRIYDIISLFEATEHLKSVVQEKGIDTIDKESVFKNYFESISKGKLLFTLKILDIVYFPSENEEVILDAQSPLFKNYWLNSERSNNIYVVNKFSGKQIYFSRQDVAELIERKIEFGSQNMEEFVDERKVVEYCYPLKLDRLGNIIEVNGTPVK